MPYIIMMSSLKADSNMHCTQLVCLPIYPLAALTWKWKASENPKPTRKLRIKCMLCEYNVYFTYQFWAQKSKSIRNLKNTSLVVTNNFHYIWTCWVVQSIPELLPFMTHKVKRDMSNVLQCQQNNAHTSHSSKGKMEIDVSSCQT